MRAVLRANKPFTSLYGLAWLGSGEIEEKKAQVVWAMKKLVQTALLVLALSLIRWGARDTALDFQFTQNLGDDVSGYFLIDTARLARR